MSLSTTPTNNGVRRTADPRVRWDLSGKIAVVTGGTSGIGRAAAIALAVAGAHVVVGGRREREGLALVADIEAADGEARFVRTDVADEADVARLIDAATSSYGRLDLAFNNAGIELGGPIEAVTQADFRHVFDINVWGIAAAMKHEVTAMLRTGAGAIVNACSIAGHVGIADFSLYNASKHAVEGLTKTAALELAGRGIRVNAVAPAFIATPMVERYVGATGEARNQLAAMHPVGRGGRRGHVPAVRSVRIHNRRFAARGRRLDRAVSAEPHPILPKQFSSERCMSLSINLTINGMQRTVELEDPRVTLLDLLRERLDLTGTKKGCDRGQCGACTVLLDGRRINSCLALAVSHDGAEVLTIEGLAEGETPHPVQAAFIAHDPFQCGFCTPGQIMSAVGLIQEGQAGDDPERVREGMSGNLCRCGAYRGITEAVLDAQRRAGLAQGDAQNKSQAARKEAA